MEMSVEKGDGITRVILAGKLDIKGAAAIDVQFAAVTGTGDRIAVDLQSVDFIASMGIRVLVMAGKSVAKRNGKFVLYGANESVTRVLSAAGLTDFMPLLDKWETAIAALA